MNCPRGNMKNEIKEITEIITRLQDCGRKRISRTEGVIVNNEDIATALYKTGYRKQSDTVKEFAEKIIAVINDCTEDYLESLPNLYTKVYVRKPTIISEIKQLAEQFGKEEK